ncbi:MAG: prepilin peptidase [Marinicella sp.]
MAEVVAYFAGNITVFYLFVFLLGLLLGSFFNVVILRMPPRLEYAWKQEYAEYTETAFKEVEPPGIALARSHCPQCKNQLKAWHNIPVFSYLFLKGRCGFCQKSISLRYPFIELLTAALMLLMAFQFGVTLQFVAACLLLWFLIVITWIDFDTYLIPDQLSLSLLWFGLFFSLFDFSLTPVQSIIGALVGYLSLWLVFHLFKILTGKEGMGYGDFKLLAAGGAWLGPEMLIVVLLLASVSGLLFALGQMIMKNKQNKIPFGPYLSIGILVSYVYGPQVMSILFPGM